jgi:hypothetical protein
MKTLFDIVVIQAPLGGIFLFDVQKFSISILFIITRYSRRVHIVSALAWELMTEHNNSGDDFSRAKTFIIEPAAAVHGERSNYASQSDGQFHQLRLEESRALILPSDDGEGKQ